MGVEDLGLVLAGRAERRDLGSRLSSARAASKATWSRSVSAAGVEPGVVLEWLRTGVGQ